MINEIKGKKPPIVLQQALKKEVVNAIFHNRVLGNNAIRYRTLSLRHHNFLPS